MHIYIWSENCSVQNPLCYTVLGRNPLFLNVSLPVFVSFWPFQNTLGRFLIIHFSNERGQDGGGVFSNYTEVIWRMQNNSRTALRKPDKLRQTTADMHCNHISHFDINLFIHVRITQTSELFPAHSALSSSCRSDIAARCFWSSLNLLVLFPSPSWQSRQVSKGLVFLPG